MINNKGFTLVELAIVLVIIGLIVGGVLVGQDLIKTAELRSIITDTEKYQAAVNTFRNKYNALPGDMRNATDIWGAADADPAQCEAAVAGAGPTCNGDGNGKLGGVINEPGLLWHQLANANLVSHSVNTVSTDGSEYPVNKTFGFSNVIIWWSDTAEGTGTDNFALNFGNALIVADFSGGGYNVFTPAEAQWLDTKKDDGRPGTGSFVTLKNASALPAATCATADDSTAEYDLSVTVRSCMMILRKFI